MNNVKFFAVNAADERLINALSEMEDKGSTYEVDSALFDRANESYTRAGLASTMLIGNLATDPRPMVDPLKKKHSDNKAVAQSTKDYIFDDNYVYEATLCFETNVYWDKKTNKRHSTNNYINLFFSTKGAKSMITHYSKGDSLLVHGYLRSLLHENPEDNTRRVNVQYLVVTDFMATPGTHLRKEIRANIGSKKSTTKKYNSVVEIATDNSLTEEEKNRLIVEFSESNNASSTQNVQNNNYEAQNEMNSNYSEQQVQETQEPQNSNPVSSNYPEQQVQEKESYKDEPSRTSTLSDEDYFGPEPDDLSAAFDDEF